MNIFLIGYRCTGKTSIGKTLAELTAKTFIDADLMLVEKAKLSVAQIVEQFGWDDFRDRETAVLKKLCTLDNHVIATGGGIILRKENIAMLKQAGTIIWLKASVETIAKRMAADSLTADQRPGLTDKGVFKEIEETLDFRRSLYENAMDFSIETDNKNIDEICSSILKSKQEF